MRPGNALLVQRLDRSECRENRIAVIARAASVKFSVFVNRDPRAGAVAPAGHLRLLVQVPVEQHRALLVEPPGCRNIEIQHRRAFAQTDDFQGQAGDALRLHPAFCLRHRYIKIAMLRPVFVKRR